MFTVAGCGLIDYNCNQIEKDRVRCCTKNRKNNYQIYKAACQGINQGVSLTKKQQNYQ